LDKCSIKPNSPKLDNSVLFLLGSSANILKY
jgi:hypothetical protein